MKLQKDLLKAIDKKENSTKYTRFEYFKTTAGGTGYDFGISNAYFIKFYSDNHFFINIDNIADRVDPLKADEIIKAGIENGKKYNYTGIIEKIENGKRSLLKFTPDNGGKDLYINAVYFDYFTTKYITPDTMQFYAINEKNPLIIKIDNYIHGLILPVNHN